MSELVLTEREGPIALVTMNRLDRLNALNDELIGLVVDALEKADRDEDVRCIVLAGGEKAFAAGADIGQMATASAMDMLRCATGSTRGTGSRTSARRSWPRCPATASAAATSSRWRAT